MPDDLSRYVRFNATEWSSLRASTPMLLEEAELESLRGINVELSLAEVEEIYLPISRLLNLYVGASQELYRASDTFLGKLGAKVPFILGIAGSVAVGKSTTARLLQSLLARWPNHPKVELVTTDGFLLPNATLIERGLLNKKGFPESYDRRALLHFLTEVKSGADKVSAPVYSHLAYDIVPNEKLTISSPDILIVEGLNVLQTGSAVGESSIFVSDFFDFSIYVDAEPDDIEKWYVERFLTLMATAFRDPQSYFHRYSELDEDQAKEVGLNIWRSINLVNLEQNIAPTRERADLIIRKGADHGATEVHLRRI